ncbi:MAG: response regulator [Promethearchaeota archaeon]
MVELKNQPNLKKNLIFWVDNDESIISLVRIATKDSLYANFVLETESLKALDRIKRISPDIIVLDIIMPRINGIKICKLIRENEQFKQTPIIAYTSLSDDKEIEEIYDAGFDFYFCKTTNILEFINFLESYKFKK